MKRFAQVLLAGALATAMWAQATPSTPAPANAGTDASQTAGSKAKVKKHHGKKHHRQAAASTSATPTK